MAKLRGCTRFVAALSACVTLAFLQQSLFAAASLVKNGAFETWKAGKPLGWSVSVGARNGRGPSSSLRRDTSGGLILAGDRSTKVWQLVSQSFAVEPNVVYRLRVGARARDVRREGNQYDNCYVGLVMKEASGERLSMAVHNVETAEWGDVDVTARASDEAATGEVWIFLSKSGSLQVRNVRVERLAPEDSFDVLVGDMDRYYSFFDLKGIDWDRLSARYRGRAEAASEPAAFVAVIREMLAELMDLHIWIETIEGETVPTYSPAWSRNFDYQAAARHLTDVEQVRQVGFVGRTRDGLGVVAIGSLFGDDATFRKLEKAVRGLMDAPGLVVDLRANRGGDERRAQRIAGMFTDRQVVYAKSRYRAGPRHGDFGPVYERMLEPTTREAYLRPIVCLVGPGCVSSGEGFAMMVKALPHATLVGQPTRGASGNPAPVSLPNGVKVHFSRWLSLLPDGTPIEGKGVVPDEVIEHRGPGDPTFDAAIDILRRKVAEADG